MGGSAFVAMIDDLNLVVDDNRLRIFIGAGGNTKMNKLGDQEVTEAFIELRGFARLTGGVFSAAGRSDKNRGAGIIVLKKGCVDLIGHVIGQDIPMVSGLHLLLFGIVIGDRLRDPGASIGAEDEKTDKDGENDRAHGRFSDEMIL